MFEEHVHETHGYEISSEHGEERQEEQRQGEMKGIFFGREYNVVYYYTIME